MGAATQKRYLKCHPIFQFPLSLAHFSHLLFFDILFPVFLFLFPSPLTVFLSQNINNISYLRAKCFRLAKGRGKAHCCHTCCCCCCYSCCCCCCIEWHTPRVNANNKNKSEKRRRKQKEKKQSHKCTKAKSAKSEGEENRKRGREGVGCETGSRVGNALIPFS